ncbi:MAG: restriction endonuclease subunit S, partial [Comamonas sp.]|nr:restriction endonuclease subunit S [Comamonas sp.]
MSNLASVLPTGWKLLSVKDAFAIRNNLRKPISQEEREKIRGEYPYYGPTKAQGYISSYEQDGKFALIGEDGDHFLKYQNISMTQLISGKCTVNNHAHVVEGTNICIAEWFYYFFMHKELTSFLTRQGAGRFKLNKAALERIPVLIPPVPEQTKITQILSTWDKAIATTERLLANSQQQKQALLRPLLSGQKRFANYPEWVNTPIAKLLTESRLPGSNGEVAKKITVKLYGNGVVAKDEKRIGSESTKYYTRKAGQFIYSKLDFLNGAFGIIPEHLDGYESTLDLPAFNFTEYVEPAWLVQYISREEFYSAQLGLANGGRKARRVNPADLLRIEIPLPSLPEQQKIAQVLSTADAEISNLQAQLAKLKLEKKALMQQLLTGQRRVKLNAETATSARAGESLAAMRLR